MKTDYAAHDVRYRRLRAEGAPGWDRDDYPEREVELSWALDGIPGGRLLEIGCGAGNAAASLVARGFDVTGIDISPTAIAWANERAIDRARFVVGDVVTSIEDVYDVVLDGHCLHCIIGDDRARLLANVHAALTPGGVFAVATMCGAITIPALRACLDPITRCQIVDGIAYRYFGDADAILDELRAAGFTVVRSTIRHRTSDDDQDHLWAVVTK